MDIIAEQDPGVVIITKKRGAGQTNLNGVWIRLAEVGKKTALGIVAAVHLVEEVDPLDTDIIIFGSNNVRVILELLDIDDGDLRFAGVIMNDLGSLYILSKGIARVDGMNDQTTTGKFALGLDQEVEPIDDKIELGNDSTPMEIVGQEVNVVNMPARFYHCPGYAR